MVLGLLGKTLTFLSKIPSPTGRPEPTIYGEILATILALAVTYGANLSTDQIGLIVVLVNLVFGVLIRQHVQPAGR
jgi:hypothetical protein